MQTETHRLMIVQGLYSLRQQDGKTLVHKVGMTVSPIGQLYTQQWWGLSLKYRAKEILLW